MQPVATFDAAVATLNRIDGPNGKAGWVVGDWQRGVYFLADGADKPEKLYAAVGFVRDVECHAGESLYVACNAFVTELSLEPFRFQNQWSQQTGSSFNYNLAVRDDGTQMIINIGGKKLHRYLLPAAVFEKELPVLDEASDLCYLPSGGLIYSGIIDYVVINTETGETLQKAPHEGSRAEVMSLSPDRKQLLVLHSHSLNVVSVEGQLKVKTLLREKVYYADAEWTTSGSHILVSDHSGKVRIVDPTKAGATDFLSLAPGQTSAIAVGSDGRTLAVGSGQYLNAKMKPMRQKTGENVIRLFALPPDLRQPAPVATAPAREPAATPKPSAAFLSALADLRKWYITQSTAVTPKTPTLITARDSYLEALRAAQVVATKEQNLDAVVAIHEEMTTVDLGLPATVEASPPVSTLQPQRMAYATLNLAWQEKHSAKKATLRSEYASNLSQLAEKHPADKVYIQAELDKLSVPPPTR